MWVWCFGTFVGVFCGVFNGVGVFLGGLWGLRVQMYRRSSCSFGNLRCVYRVAAFLHVWWWGSVWWYALWSVLCCVVCAVGWVCFRQPFQCLISPARLKLRLSYTEL